MYGENRRSGSGFGGRPRGDFGGPRTPPVNVGDELDVKIEAIGEKGDGVAKQNGFVLFVPGVKQGENVRIKVTRVLRKVGFAEVLGRGAATEEAAAEQPQEEQYSEENDSENFGEDSESSEETSEEPAAETSEDSEEF